MNPIRFDILEESYTNFLKNMVWGMWVNNEYMTGELTCGSCGMKSELDFRSEDLEVQCPYCGVMNLIKAFT